MKLTVFFDHIFTCDSNGRVFTRLTFDTAFWKRYLAAFEEVRIVSRLQRTDRIPPGASPADGKGIVFVGLPVFVGPWRYLRVRRDVGRIVAHEVARAEAVILRVPSTIGTLAWRLLRRASRPFGVEVVADPGQTLAPGGVRSLLRPIARISQVRAMRRQCQEACATAYVSREALQRVYPPGRRERSTSYSSIDLHADDVLRHPRSAFGGAHRIIQVGTLETLYKGPDILVEAIRLCARPNLRLTIVGDGRRRADVEALVRQSGLADQVSFSGRLPAGAAIREQLDQSDLFVMASRTEGLPKAMIEAMARGLPCIGTSVGGIPELLPPSMLVPPDNPAALATKILEILADEAGLAEASIRNLAVAREYTSDVLDARRSAFYDWVKSST